MVHTPPYDFAHCNTHDTTFPIGSNCEWHGVTSVREHLEATIDSLRGRAVSAEQERDALLQIHAESGPWVDRQGDVWNLGNDGLLHTRETAPLSAAHVNRKWGPLITLEQDAEFALLARYSVTQTLEAVRHLSANGSHMQPAQNLARHPHFTRHVAAAIAAKVSM